ncbi:ImmA/IrrE family metallo-endopeptidase [Paracoccus sanguinis]|uniref:ImmA/IrrE family metallo-endopeptidase n=1 Tax=Paracoccus sanguinis TaxID=1545044 RepID=UPI0009E01C0B|nr:ImmA/IrrE family metallo-endopeptidase [Paracoccus sanguinis]
MNNHRSETPDRPKPLYAPKHLVEKFAEQVAKELGYVPGGPIHNIVAELGGRIRYDDNVLMDETCPEAIVVDPDGKFEIALPTVTSEARDRFTIAHELGHFFLHFPQVQKMSPSTPMAATRRVDENDKEQQRAEWEANWFAASFLMPEIDFRKHYPSGLNHSASFFGVSRRAIDVRARSLKINA